MKKEEEQREEERKTSSERARVQSLPSLSSLRIESIRSIVCARARKGKLGRKITAAGVGYVYYVWYVHSLPCTGIIIVIRRAFLQGASERNAREEKMRS